MVYLAAPLRTLRGAARTLPLGIDLGATRVRVALVRQSDDGPPELAGVAVRDHAGDLAGAVTDAVAELRTHERRCVLGLSEPRALIRSVRFPPMRRTERERAARFEAAKYIAYPLDEATVRVVTLDAERSVLGIARADAIAAVNAAAKTAKLRVTAIDNDGFALRRALPGVDAVLDIGRDASRLHVFTAAIPVERRIGAGGAAFTGAIARAFGCDDASAERRKQAFGIAGCADGELALLVADVANALVDFRVDGIGDVRSIALTGNGARLSGLAELLERATAVRVRPAALDPTISRTLPPDVLRAAAPDWCLAYGLALWSAA